MRCKGFLYLLLVTILLAGCANLDLPNDLDLDITVPPQPEEKYAEFSVVVTRIGEQIYGIGWHASGVVYLKVALVDVGGGLNVSGTGVGTAGFDASGPGCIDAGGWPVEYTAQGNFNKDKCELTIFIEETWPHTEAHALCMGYSGSFSGGAYKLMFPTLKFTQDDTREDTSTNIEGLITWINTFKLYPMKGLEDTLCSFEAPSP